MVAASLLSVTFLGCLSNVTRGSPYDLILDSDQIQGDWTITSQELEYISWDRVGGRQILVRYYDWLNSTLYIEVTVFGILYTAETNYPMHEPPSGTKAEDINIGNVGIYWTSSPDFQYIHFRKGNTLVYSWLHSPGQPELDKKWYADLMNLEASLLAIDQQIIYQ